MYKLIVFDIDGTLVDTKYSICKGLQNLVFKKLGKKYPLEDLEFAFGSGGPETLESLGLKEENLADWLEEVSSLSHTIHPFDGIKEMLADIHAKGIALGIASSKYREELDYTLGAHGILKYFQHIVCFDDVENPKPHPEPIYKAADMAGVSTKDILFIGDTEYDIDCAKNSGVDFALAGWSASDDLKASCKICPETPQALLQYI